MRFVARTLARDSYCVVSRTAQSVGSRKLPQPYSANALRNRLPVAFARDPLPFTSSLQLGIARHSEGAFRTIAGASQAPLVMPMHARTGWTNSGIVAEMTSRLKKSVLD